MNPNLENLKKLIEEESYKNHVNTNLEFWGGADVIIAPEEDERTRKFMSGQNVVINFQQFKPQRQVVITKFASELSWLFHQLRDCCTGTFDYASKYDFFGLLAFAAKKHLQENSETDCDSLLLAVLKQGGEWMNSHEPR